jgi:hypothetical protein
MQVVVEILMQVLAWQARLASRMVFHQDDTAAALTSPRLDGDVAKGELRE